MPGGVDIFYRCHPLIRDSDNNMGELNDPNFSDNLIESKIKTLYNDVVLHYVTKLQKRHVIFLTLEKDTDNGRF